MKKTIGFIALVMIAAQMQSQVLHTHSDSVRGSITHERIWWDLTHYDLHVKCDPASKTIEGYNIIRYTVLNPKQVMQIDLQPPLVLDSAVQEGKRLSFSKNGQNAYLISLQSAQPRDGSKEITIYYHGTPREARNAPWDGGFSWSKDKSGNPFVATSCQGLGASAWWPCKDHMYDEPDSMKIHVTVPDPLVDVSNGRLIGTSVPMDGWKTYSWEVKNPINNYGVNINVGNYVHWSDTFQGEKGKLDLLYYVLPEDLEKSKEQFKQVSGMLKAMEHWFGPYPFYEDGYKLVQVPYLGMEHQSSVTYGNQFKNGYLGSDMSGTGWGLKWDYIIIHESGHEWFANNITYKDIADMWIHESFTTYSECLYTEYMFGKKAGAEYVIGQRKRIMNDQPIIGKYDVNQEGSGDMYFKGANMLHTIRQLVGNDELWREILRGLNKEYYHQTVSSNQIELYLIEKSGVALKPVFDQYLRTKQIPVLEVKRKKGKVECRWTNCVDGFNMQVELECDGKTFSISPTSSWKEFKIPGKKPVKLDEDYYASFKLVK